MSSRKTVCFLSKNRSLSSLSALSSHLKKKWDSLINGELHGFSHRFYYTLVIKRFMPVSEVADLYWIFIQHHFKVSTQRHPLHWPI